jgi:hypothetical protein|tara:strand:- start:7856 stop:8158 length:303 start_codon:yes stop_codon:yes gene_type:complete
MEDDYELFVEEYKPSKAELMKIFNDKIRANAKDANEPKGIEINVLPEWESALQENSSILTVYEKRGWKVMWYKIHSDGPGQGKLCRSWISFRNPAYVKKE